MDITIHASFVLEPPVADPGVTDDERRTIAGRSRTWESLQRRER